MQVIHNFLRGQNRPLPNSKNRHFQNEARCTTFLVKISFICMRMKNDFHIKGWAPTLVLKQRPGELGNGLLPTPLNSRLQDICILMYKSTNYVQRTYICNVFNNHYNSSFFTAVGWGKLPPDLTSANTLNIFKSEIRTNDVSLIVDDGCI